MLGPEREERPLSGDAQKTKAELIAELVALRETVMESTLERSRQVLRESEERFHILTETSQDAIEVISETGQTLSVNPAIQVLLDYTPEECLDMKIRDWAKILHPDDFDRVVEQFEQVKESGKTVYYDPFRCRRGDGMWIWVKAIGTSFVSASGELRILEVTRDITEQMEAERTPQYPRLYSQRGFQYCDQLLAPWERRAWQAIFPAATPPDAADLATTLDDIAQRAGETLQWLIENRKFSSLHSFALDHLTLARVALYRSQLEQTPLPDPSDPESHIAGAVTGLRKSGVQDHLPRGLLTLAWYRHEHEDEAGARAALDEAEAIASRGPMPLHLADIHLHRARLFADRAELDKARVLIEKHGYNRRLPELHDAEAALPPG